MNPTTLSSQTQYNTSIIRKLLLEAFSDEEFTIFCYDNFREVHRKFSTITFTAKVQLLIEHCEKNNNFAELLSLVNQANPSKYNQLVAWLPQESHSPVRPVGQATVPPASVSQNELTPSPPSLLPVDILVVEDDPTWQTILQECLVETGHQVELATTFDEARHQLRNHQFNLVTLDARLQSKMQSSEGILLLDYIRNHLKAPLPIIIISGEIDRRDLIRAFRDFSVSNVFLKDYFDYGEFSQAVSEALQITRQ